MKRPGPVRRRTPLRRSEKEWKRRVPLMQREDLRSRFPKRRHPAYVAWIRTLACLITGKRPVQCCHVISQGAGGDDVGNTVPMIARLHREQHVIGIESFQAKYGVDLAAEARALVARYPHQQELAA